MVRKPGNSKYVKKLNRMNIVNMIKDQEPISRQQIAEISGLTPAAITGIIRELIDMGFVREEGLGESQGGRRPVNLKFIGTAGHVLGIEVTSQEVSFGVADLKNFPQDFDSVNMDMHDPETAIPALIEKVKEWMTSPLHKDKRFLGVAVAFPAILTVKQGIVQRAVNLGPKWSGLPLKAMLQDALSLPVFIETNSKVAALGEKWYGAGTKCENLVYINMGEGISAGIIWGGSILQGTHGHAGQVGHTVVVENGPLCNCGNRGCLEALCGIPALTRKASAELPVISNEDTLKKRYMECGQITIQDILQIARQEDSYSRELLRGVGQYIGSVTAGVINLYNPDEVFLGGKLTAAADSFIEEFREYVRSHVFPELKHTPITVSKLGENSGVIGACALALKNLFTSSDSELLEGSFERTQTV